MPDTHKRLEEGGALTADYPVNKISSSKSPPLPGAPATPSLPPAKKLEICYLSQLRKSPYVINGVYKLHHHTAHNHFRRYADIKQRGEVERGVAGVKERVWLVKFSPPQKCSLFPCMTWPTTGALNVEQVHGSSTTSAPSWRKWYVPLPFPVSCYDYYVCLQETLEDDVLVVMERIQKVLETIKTTPSSLLDGGALTSTEELIQVLVGVWSDLQELCCRGIISSYCWSMI